MIPIMCFNKLNPFGQSGNRLLLTFRGLTNTFGLILLYLALRFIPPSDLSAIGHTSIIVTALLSRIFLKEKLGIPHLFALALTVLGVFFISKPSFLFDLKPQNKFVNKTNYTSNQLESEYSADFLFKLGISLVIGSAFMFGSAHILIKKLCNSHVHWSVSTVYGAYYGLPITGPISFVLYNMGFTHQTFDLNLFLFHLLYSVISALLGICGNCFLNIVRFYL